MWSGVAVVVAVLLPWTSIGFTASEPDGVQEAQTATAREQFELAHDALHSLADGYSSDVLKTIASLLLVMGWLMMSEAARNFLQQSATSRRTALVVVPVLAVANAVWLWDRFATSEAQANLLNSLGYVSEVYYADDRITVTLWITNLVVHLTLFAALFALVYSQKDVHVESVVH